MTQGETLLVVYDTEHRMVLDPIGCAAHELGVGKLTGHLYVDERTLKDVLPSYDATIICVSDRLTLSLGHSDARLDACRSGSRIAFLTQPLAQTPPPHEILRVAQATHNLKTMLAGARNLVVETLGNTHRLEAHVGGREPVAITSLITEPGMWGAIPDYAEVAIAPLEWSANGSFVADACVVGLGPLKENLTIKVGGGRVNI
ncbi:MAG: hypothetical protein QW429_06025, partial [Thermoprotei archaeon]